MKDFVMLHGHCSVDCSLLLKQSKWKTEHSAEAKALVNCAVTC